MTKPELKLTSRACTNGAPSKQSDVFLRDLPLSYLETLLAVAETGSFRRAAEKLNLNQSAVSRRIRSVEEHCGVSMFERSASGSTLTTAGDTFIRESRRILRHLDNALSEARSAGIGSTGQLRIGLTASTIEEILFQIVETFALRHPNVSFSFLQGAQSELLTGLSHRRIDAVFSHGRPSHVGTDTLLIGEEEIFLVLPTQDHGSERYAGDSSHNETFLVGCDVPFSAVEEHIRRRARMRKSRSEIKQLDLGRDSIIALVGLGLGMGLITNASLASRHPRVRFVPFEDRRCKVSVSLSWRPENDNPALRRLISLARIEAKKSAAVSSASRSRGRSS